MHQRDCVSLVTLANHIADGIEDASVHVFKEIIGLHYNRSRCVHIIVSQYRAQEGLFGLDVVGQIRHAALPSAGNACSQSRTT